MHDADTLLIGMIAIVAISFVVFAIVFPLWIILHHALLKLDDILLREPFFKKSEQLNCLVWPLSYLKTVNYIGLIAAPRYAKKVRFKGFDEELPVGKATVIACKVQFTLMCFCAILFFVYFGYGAYAMYVLP